MNNARKPDHDEDEGTSGEIEASRITATTIPFAKLVSDHLEFVWRCLRRFGVQSADVDDSAQQVFLVANQKLASIRPGSERAFLIGVATRVASHARRAHQRREAAQQRMSEFLPHAYTPEDFAQRTEARDLLDRVLDKMPADLRSVFVLFELEELSVDEVADLLRIPRGTVATRLRRARRVFQHEARLLDPHTREGER